MSATTTSTIAAAIAAHLAARTASGDAPATVARCRTHLTRFATWCEARGLTTLRSLTPAILERYQAWLSTRRQPDGRPLAWSTQAHELTAVRMLCAWATRTKRLLANPATDLALPRQPKRLPRAVLSVSEAERVLAEPDVTTLLGLRDRAILEVLYSTGLRRMEVIGLELTDLDPERGVVFVLEGKGKKDRLVPVGERAIRWTLRYLDDARPRLVRCHRSSPCHALFLSRRGTRIRPTRLTERLHRYVTASGVGKPGSVHLFRHTMATLMHDAGCDIRDLQAMLGHAQLSTTEIYTHVSVERLKAVHARTHPAHLPPIARDHAPASSSLAAALAADGTSPKAAKGE